MATALNSRLKKLSSLIGPSRPFGRRGLIGHFLQKKAETGELCPAPNPRDINKRDFSSRLFIEDGEVLFLASVFDHLRFKMGEASRKLTQGWPPLLAFCAAAIVEIVDCFGACSSALVLLIVSGLTPARNASMSRVQSSPARAILI
jgi:hypothetical protein